MKSSLPDAAARDIEDILYHTLEEYNHDGLMRYQLLITETINSLATNIEPIGLQDPINGHHSYHLRYKKKTLSTKA